MRASDSPAMPVMIHRLDHLVLTVEDLGRTQEFYDRTLGLTMHLSPSGRRSMHFGLSKINVHPFGTDITPRALNPTPGSADICLVTGLRPDDVMRHLDHVRVAPEVGPIRRTGALGSMISVYLRDPDGNLVEISSYQS